jgi:anthranilate/para-aminobenzoate synthase component I
MIKILPSKRSFIEHAKRGNLSPLYTELPFIPPQQVYESIQGPNSFLLESIKGPEKIARYSFAGTDPVLSLKVKNGDIALDRHESGITTDGHVLPSPASPLKTLREVLLSYTGGAPVDPLHSGSELPPFAGGAVGMISYDFVHYFERLPKTAIDDLMVPDAHFLIVDTVAACDHRLKKTFITSCPGTFRTAPGSGASETDLSMNYDRACEKINSLYQKITRLNTLSRDTSKRKKQKITILHDMEKDRYVNMVKKTKEYIKAGDIFQANLSQRVSAHVGTTEQWEIYRILSRINPSPFAAFMDMGEYHIVSSSPERLLRFSRDIVETRPIAGTRPRGTDDKDDQRMRIDLLVNEKERAEHLMLIDLERNDLGKISDYGSVVVDEFMITEDYSHVIHIVSNVMGTVARGKNCFDAIRAAFPGGTITGVPKVRCMEIIDELEPVTRGPYTGSLGYISFGGDMDLNIIIRSFVIKNNTAYVQAGAGIVADSDPEREYTETLKKAEALIRTLEML